MRLETRVGYGFAVPGTAGLLTPNAGVALNDAGERRYSVGARFGLADAAAFEVTGERDEASGREAEHVVGFGLRLIW